MKLSFPLLAAFVFSSGPAMAQTRTVPLWNGMVITSSVRIAPGTYMLPGADSGVITIRGNDITVDFRGAVMRGVPQSSDPDAATGIGIRIVGGRNVRILNARVHGYKIGLYATDVRGLKLINNDFSYNWKPRLYSVIEHESLADWLSHHHNEAGEWLRFGAGIYLSGVIGGEVRGNRIEQGMEGLMLNRTDSLLVWNNTFEYNSGVGIGMYRSSYNRILHNHASYNVRGFSRYYRRGQDSADLLMYEQSSHNIVAYNMMTHGGDGLFLWAGQSTMDTGQGGANDNVFYANDFSYAPANAIEATFSRNVFDENVATGSDYGVWGGYSFDSKFTNNDFSNNRTGVAIEHGQNNEIAHNHMNLVLTGINLWANRIEPSEWGYPKFRDTRSVGYSIHDNEISDARVGIRLSNTRASTVMNNTLSWLTSADSAILRLDSSVVVADGNKVAVRPAPNGRDYVLARPVLCPAEPRAVAPLPGGLYSTRDRCRVRAKDGQAVPGRDKRDEYPRDAIKVDGWGPYSYTYPRLWPVDTVRGDVVRLQVLGPTGRWKVVSSKNVTNISQRAGASTRTEPQSLDRDTISITPATGHETDWSVTVEFRADAPITDAHGVRYAPGKPYTFSFSRFEPITGWDVSFYSWPDSAKPREKLAAFDPVYRAAISSTPLLTRHESRLDYMFYGAGVKGVPQDRWAAVATTSVTLAAGTEYTLRALSDDGARVYVDGRLAIDSWAPHETAVGNSPIAPGRHDIRVEYYQIDGWSELRVDIVKGVQKSNGSPGPH